MSETSLDVGPLSDFPEDGLTKVTIEGQDVVVIRQGGEVFAVPDRYPLHDGELLDGKIKCMHHGARTRSTRCTTASCSTARSSACITVRPSI